MSCEKKLKTYFRTRAQEICFIFAFFDIRKGQITQYNPLHKIKYNTFHGVFINFPLIFQQQTNMKFD